MVDDVLARAAVSITDEEWDVIITDWNHLPKRSHRQHAIVCGREGHVDVMTSTGRWVCVRCLRYQPTVEE